MPSRPLKVFLCHAHADRDPVRGLYTRLTQDGVDAWLDKAKLLPGQDWELEIRNLVSEADRINNNRAGYVLLPDYHQSSYFTVIVKGPWTSSFKVF
jgi:hypothetical protein